MAIVESALRRQLARGEDTSGVSRVGRAEEPAEPRTSHLSDEQRDQGVAARGRRTVRSSGPGGEEGSLVKRKGWPTA